MIELDGKISDVWIIYLSTTIYKQLIYEFILHS